MKDILDKTKTIEFLKNVISDKNIELEYIYGNKDYESKLESIKDPKKKEREKNHNIVMINKDVFNKCLEYCKSNLAYVDNVTDLDIGQNDKDIRATVNGLYHIKNYCKKDILEECEPKYMLKQRKDKIDDNEYNYRLNMKSEIYKNSESPEVHDFMDNYSNKMKTYRYKRRFSFITDDMLYRIDLTGVKMANGKTFKTSRLLQMPEKYEVEIEYIGNMMCNRIPNITSFKNGDNSHIKKNNTYMDSKTFGMINPENKLEPLDETINLKDLYKDIKIEDLYTSFNSIVYTINTIIYETENIMSMSEKYIVLKNYSKLCKTKRFFGPDLITLNRDSLDSNKVGNIFSNYLVTEKADGERYLYYIDNDKHGYLINKKMVVKDSGKTFPKCNDEWLIDGEYITSDKNGQPINLYMIFDVYFANEEMDESKKPIYMYPFYNTKNKLSRGTILNTFKYILENSKNIYDIVLNIELKTYYMGESKYKSGKSSTILEKSNSIWSNSDNYRYKIDGLIYLPSDLSVGGDYNTIKKDISGRWNYNYKWKPPEENTIDFQVEVKKEDKREVVNIYTESDKNGNTIDYNYKTLNLLVGYSLHKDDINFRNIDYCMKILENRVVEKVERENVKFVGKTNEWYNECSDKGITNITLNEGRMLTEYGENISNGDIVEFRYNPESKNCQIWEPMRLRRDKDKPQDFKVADNVWQTIIDPITTKMITGDTESIEKYVNVPTLERDDYYIGKSENLDSLRDLHNYIKYNLILGIGNAFKKNINILDTSIGQGGDLNRYLNNKNVFKCKFLLGLDIAPVEEACRRYYMNTNKYDKNKSVFLTYDTSKNIKNKSGLEFDVHAETMLNILYDIKDTNIDSRYKNIDKVYRGLANERFHLISSQFSIHYYFKNKDTLNGYIQNLYDNIKSGGYFIGTCYDGNRIFERLKDPKPFTYKNKKTMVYSVKKKYDIENFDYNPSDTSNMLGQTISVYMESIGQEIDEYLVNFEYFVETMKTYEFVPELPENLKEKYKNVLKTPIGSFNETIQNIDSIIKNDKSIERYYKNMKNIVDIPELSELSSMNNYFIFKKI